MCVEVRKKELLSLYGVSVLWLPTEDLDFGHNITKELVMLAAKQQWCPRCQRHVQTEQKPSPIGRQKKLIKITVTCGRCRITLTSKTTSASALEQQENTKEKDDV